MRTATKLSDGEEPADAEPDERADRQRDVQVEDLLDEPLIRVERRVEEDQREAGQKDQRGCDCVDSEAGELHTSCRRPSPRGDSRKRQSQPPRTSYRRRPAQPAIWPLRRMTDRLRRGGPATRRRPRSSPARAAGAE